MGDLAREDSPNDSVVSWVPNLRRRLRRRDVLGRRVHGTRGTSATLQLAAQHSDLLLIPDDLTHVRAVKRRRIRLRDSLLLEAHLGLFHLINFLSNHLHFLNLGLDYGQTVSTISRPSQTEPPYAKTRCLSIKGAGRSKRAGAETAYFDAHRFQFAEHAIQIRLLSDPEAHSDGRHRHWQGGRPPYPDDRDTSTWCLFGDV